MKRHIQDFNRFSLNENEEDFLQGRPLLPINVMDPGAQKKAYIITLDGEPKAIASNADEAQEMALSLGEQTYSDLSIDRVEQMMLHEERIEIYEVGLPHMFRGF